MDLSTIFCPRLPEEIYFYFKFDSESLQVTFLVDFSISKTHSLLKLIITATELRQRPKFDAFHKELFCTLASSKNLVLKVVTVVVGNN